MSKFRKTSKKNAKCDIKAMEIVEILPHKIEKEKQVNPKQINEMPKC